MNSSRPTPRLALRGAARVSIAWLITFLVLFFASLFFAYVAFDAEAKAIQEMEVAQAAKAVAEQRFDEDSSALAELSRAVGFYDREGAVANADPALVTAALEELRATFSEDIKEDVVDLEGALPRVAQAYNARGVALATAGDELAAVKTAAESQDSRLSDALKEKDGRIDDLTREKTDLETNAAQKQTELENRIAALNTQRNQLDAELRTARAEAETQRRSYEDQLTTLETRLRNMGNSLAFLDAPEAVDGSLLAVSKDLDLGWIDIGAKNRLARGTTFRVVSGSVGSSKVKAMATVTAVEANRAEVHFHSLADRFDPPVPGDLIFNPLYDPHGQRTAVLAGRFSGLYNEGELRVLLSEMGIHVQESLGLDTDYLIVGSELFTDPATGEPLEDPLPASELPVYKDAESRGTLIVPIKDLREYFRS